MKYHATTFTLPLPQNAEIRKDDHEPDGPHRSSARSSLTSRAAKLQLMVEPQRSRLEPPLSRRRIYSDSELACATEMFLKLRDGEDRRPRPISISNDPLDCIAETLLDLLEV